MTRDEINEFGERVKDQLLKGDGAILVSFSVHPGNDDCHLETCKATVGGPVMGKGYMEFTSHAVHLYDAIHMARAKLREARKKKDAD